MCWHIGKAPPQTQASSPAPNFGADLTKGGVFISASSMGGTCGKGISTPDDWLLGLSSPALTLNHSRWTLEQTEVSSKQWKSRFLIEDIERGPSPGGGKNWSKRRLWTVDKQTLFIPTPKEARRQGRINGRQEAVTTGRYVRYLGRVTPSSVF